jgi:negative regulator of replication initiation
MRTTITLDDDVVALIESERTRTGESFRAAINRLLRRSARATPPQPHPALPELPGRPLVDLSDVSALLAALDDERRAQRGVT